ncbi:MAG: class I adenylate cyclase [Gammaproteobacteria bacterium]
MDVLKARDTFYRWSEICLERYLSGLTEQQKFSFRLIPLIFQTNHHMLPAYVSADTAAGIYGYKPDKQLLRDARKINHRFSYDLKRPLKNTLIEALYLKFSVLDDSVQLILIHRPDIEEQQKQQLDSKMSRLIHWLETEQLHITGWVLTAQKLALVLDNNAVSGLQSAISNIDSFYFESILLAGKYPLWWLIPPGSDNNYNKMVQHIEHAHYVDDREYIDFGPASEFKINKFLISVKRLMRQGYADDSILFRYCLTWQAMRMKRTCLLSAALKAEVFDEQKELQLLSINQVYIQTMHQIVRTLFGQDEWKKICDLYGLMIGFADTKMLPLLVELSGKEVDKNALFNNPEKNLALFMDAKQGLQTFVTAAASRVIEQLTKLDLQEDDIELLTQVLELYHRQYNTADLVTIINQRNISSISQDKILIRELASQHDISYWVLVIQDEQGDKRVLHRLKSLLALIAWAWLNRIIDQNTQVSIDCPGYQVKQIEVRYALETLVAQLSDDYWQHIKQHQGDEPDRASKSLIFVRLVSAAEDKLIVNSEVPHQDNVSGQILLFEQLLVNRWGEVHYRLFYGDEGIVSCFCDWLNNVNLDDEHIREYFKLYSYSSGETNYHVQQLADIFDEMIGFFVQHGDQVASYILNMGINYFVISQQQGKYSYQKIAGELAVYQYLEQDINTFKSVGIHKHVLSETPLVMLYGKNRKGRVQLCFQGVQGQYDIWIVDERGSLWHSKQDIMDFEQLISHWLLFIRNTVNQYQKADIAVPGFELFYAEPRAAGGFKLSKVNTEGISVKLSESLSVNCRDLVKGEELSLQIADAGFDYLEYGDNAMDQCADYILRNAPHTATLVTDIGLSNISPGSNSAREIQFVHFLKLKRRVEFELRQLLSEPEM